MEQPNKNYVDYELPVEDISNLDVAVFKVFFEQAAKRLDGVLKNAELISSRAQQLVTLTSGILIASMAYSAGQFTNGDSFLAFLGTYVACYSAYILYPLVYKGFSGDYVEAGTEPEALIVPAFWNEGQPEGLPEKQAYRRLIISYSERIQRNLVENARRWIILDKTRDRLIRLTLSVPVLFLIHQIVKAWCFF